MIFLFLSTILFNANFLLWLIPSLYTAAVQHAPLHDLQSLLFLLTGLLNWWPLMTPIRTAHHWAHPIQLLYLTLDGLPLGVTCVILFLVAHPLYAVYTTAPQVWGITPLADLQVGSVILYAPGLLLDVIMLSLIFFRWLAQQEQETRQLEEAEGSQDGKHKRSEEERSRLKKGEPEIASVRFQRKHTRQRLREAQVTSRSQESQSRLNTGYIRSSFRVASCSFEEPLAHWFQITPDDLP